MGRFGLAGAIVVGALALAQGAAASWLEQTTPNPAGARVWQLNGVSCTSGSACTAVGSVLDAAGGHPLVERRSGSTWTIQPVPEPAGASDTSLGGVSCTSASACTAVGDYFDGTATVTLAEAWNGTSWTVQATPEPGGAATSRLGSVACASASACIAVGNSSDGTHAVTLAEAWNGTSWTIQSVPQPAGTTSSELDGVACTSATACVAVGDYFDGTKTRTLAERWNGTSWTIEPTPNPGGAGASLEGVSCSSPTACTAVGDGFAERRNGTTWSLQAIAPVPHANTGAHLSRVSCASATACTAVGGFFNHEAILTLVAEAWNGASWKVQATPLTSVNDSSLLSDVSCTSPTACTAAGSVHNPVTGNRATVEDFALRWQDASPEAPAGAIASSLDAVSCGSARACIAVGGLEESGGTFSSLSEVWDGRSWTFESTPNGSASVLSGVSCTSATACTAVGDVDAGGTIETLAERWDGTSWTVQSTPSPVGAPRSFLLGVSCSSATACTAVGFFVAAGGAQRPLAEAWNGTTWTIQSTPRPAGATASQLNGVSCTSAAFCSAVGSAVVAGRTEMLAETWNGTSWRTESTPDPPGGSNSFLGGVSCTSASACTAAGNFFDGTHTVPLVERWSGTAWAREQIAPPAGATATNLKSTSCASASACAVVGSFAGSDGARLTLAEGRSGSSWAVQSSPNPLGAHTSFLSGVSCVSQRACMAVGTSTDSSGTETLLAEQYS